MTGLPQIGGGVLSARREKSQILLKAASTESGGTATVAADRVAALRRKMELAPRLLLIRLRSLGDCILALPLVEVLHAWRPELKIDVLVEAPYAAVFSRHPAVNETLVIEARNEPAQVGWSRARACIEIRKRCYAAVVNLHGGSTSLIFTLFSGAAIRIGQEKYRHRRVYTDLIPPPPTVWQRADLHTVEDQLTLLPWLDLPVPERPCGRLHLEDDVRHRIAERLRASGVRPGEFLLIHPTATQRTKQWQEENFARLGDRLNQRCSLPVIFTSGPRETQVLLDVGRHTRLAHRYWSDLGLSDLFALIESCRLFIGNDSGPTHAAAALDKPLVVIWGSSDFQVWRPWEAEYETVRSDLPCMPCPGYTCTAFGEPRCVCDITVDRVYDSCARVLGLA